MMNRLLLAAGVLAALSVPAFAQATSRGPALLIHGNYCGPGNNAPLPPVDALDLACAHHDACTPNGGLPSPACNARLQREAENVAHDPREPEDLRALAGVVALGATLMPSDPRRPTYAVRSAPQRVWAPRFAEHPLFAPATSADTDEED